MGVGAEGNIWLSRRGSPFGVRYGGRRRGWLVGRRERARGSLNYTRDSKCGLACVYKLPGKCQ